MPFAAGAVRVEAVSLTVAVMSAEQISQMYLMPPSVVLTAVFFLMRPISARPLMVALRLQGSRCRKTHTGIDWRSGGARLSQQSTVKWLPVDCKGSADGNEVLSCCY